MACTDYNRAIFTTYSKSWAKRTAIRSSSHLTNAYGVVLKTHFIENASHPFGHDVSKSTGKSRCFPFISATFCIMAGGCRVCIIADAAPSRPSISPILPSYEDTLR